MNDPDDAQGWRDMGQHLIEAHGGSSGGLAGYAPALDQLCFPHADIHVALASIGALPPDRHTHPAPVDAGWCDRRPESYRLFPPSASAQNDPLLGLHGFFPLPSDTVDRPGFFGGPCLPNVINLPFFPAARSSFPRILSGEYTCRRSAGAQCYTSRPTPGSRA